MAGKDIAEKSFEALNDVFADIVNVLLFDGEALIKKMNWSRGAREVIIWEILQRGK